VKAAERREVSRLLRHLLDAVGRGDLEATTPQERALVTYIAGYVAGLEAADEVKVPRRETPSEPRTGAK
jgi:hypothetical protein